MAAQTIDLARAATVAIPAGVTSLPMSSETMKVAIVESDPDSSFVREGEQIPLGAGTFGVLELRARVLACYCVVSIPLMRDASNSASLIESTITQSLAHALDEAILSGNGSGENPTGLLYSSQVTNSAVSAAFSYEDLVDAKLECWNRNVEPVSFLQSPGLRSYIAKMRDGEGRYYTTDGLPELANLRRFTTSAISDTGNVTTAYTGDFSNVILGIRNQIEIEISGVADDVFRKMQVAVRAFMRCDVGFGGAGDVTKMSLIDLS